MDCGLPRREATRNDNVKIDEKEFVEGLWEDSPNSSKNNVEKSQLESVEKETQGDGFAVLRIKN